MKKKLVVIGGALVLLALALKHPVLLLMLVGPVAELAAGYLWPQTHGIHVTLRMVLFPAAVAVLAVLALKWWDRRKAKV